MTSALPARSLMGIGDVLSALRRDFPDVTISKIRFLESEGLVEPARTPSGYRKFSAADLDRLRYVLSAQRDQYLPLRVIKANLEALDRGLSVTAPTGGAAPSWPGVDPAVGWSVPGADDSEARLSRSELLHAAGIDADLLTQLEDHGLVSPRPGTAHYDNDAVLIARTVGEMRAYGLEPRHLRAFRTTVDRATGLVEQVVTPLLRQNDPQARSRAAEVAREMGALAVRLHVVLLRSALRGVARE
jgi:DNA-binding transcriptional MerR regulator